MRAPRLLSAALALVTLLALSGCGNGTGLRVEGPEPQAQPSVSEPSVVGTTEGFAPGRKPTPTPSATPITVSLAQVRLELLADKALDPYSRRVLSKCLVIDRCLSRGPVVNVLDSARPQLVVLIHTLEHFVFGAFLMAVDPTGPRRVWSIKGDQLRINAGAGGDLVVESAIFAVDDEVCCPSVTRVEVYRWNGRQMIKLSSQDQKGD